MFNFRINILEAVQVAREYLLFHFLGFLPAGIIRSVYVSPCSSLDCDLSYDILDLADVANVFIANPILQSVAIECALKPSFPLFQAFDDDCYVRT